MLSKVIPGFTHRLGPPKDMKNCDHLFVKKYENVMVSRWEPTPQELKMLNEGGSVDLWVWGNAHPPVALTVAAAGSVLPDEL